MERLQRLHGRLASGSGILGVMEAWRTNGEQCIRMGGAGSVGSDVPGLGLSQPSDGELPLAPGV